MPSKNKETAHQALEMLENYYRNLTRPEDAVLKTAIDRLTCIFKSRLFQALLDIQEFCEVVLNDSDKDLQTKVLATHAMADRWELKSPFHSSPDENSCASLNMHYSYDDHWTVEEIVIDRPPGVGLGFSIAGGTDAPCIPNDCSIFVTRITPNGLTDRDRRLRIHDIILQVNNTSFSNISHSSAVDTLKKAGDKVYLRVKRLNPPFVEEIKLQKGSRGLGFSIAGGINSEIISGDHGVFVTQIFPDGPADIDGRLMVGDRLIMVQTAKNDFDLTFVDHVQARDFIMQASEDSDTVILVVGHPTSVYNYTSGTTGKSSVNGDDILRENRKIVLTKNSNGFGFNIVGGEEGEGIFVSFILTGGPADLNGKLRKGDQILSVNNIDLRYASHEEAASTLKNAGQTAVLIVRYRPNEFSRYEARVNDIREQFMEATNDMPSSNGPPAAIFTGGGTLRTSMKRQFFVRAFFDYDATKDCGLPGRGLCFRRGDILHVTNAADDDWWQARRIDVLSGQEEDLGIIPSKKRVERKEKARMRKVNFGKIDSKCGSLDRKKKRKFGIFGKDKKDLQSGEDTDNDQVEESIVSYVPVVQQEVNYARPVVVLGPVKDRINEDLIHEHPDLFGICVPHTTRPKRDKEIDGKDYHFVASREQMERDIQNHLFIEAGQFNSNLYGTSVASVREVAEKGKKCVLDVSGHAIRRLQLAGLHPIAVFINPKSVNNILELNKRLTIDHATKLFERSQKLEQDFKEYFTGVVEGDTYDEIYAKVKEIIAQNSGPTIWVQSDEKI